MLVHAPLNICLGLAGTGYGSPAIVTGLMMGVTAGGGESRIQNITDEHRMVCKRIHVSRHKIIQKLLKQVFLFTTKQGIILSL